MRSEKTGNKLILRQLTALVMASAMATVLVSASASSPRPKLVVGVMIEGLSLDQIEILRQHLSEGGFARLMRDGVTIDNLDYGAAFDPAAAATIVYTGASPSVSGIDASSVYDPGARRDRSSMFDGNYRGAFTDQTLSPRAIGVSTLGDEVRIHSDGVGSVHSLALSPEVAIAMSGHAGNSAFWLNGVNGSWATTSYYKEMPTAAQHRNHYQPLASRLDTLAWVPSMPIGDYPDLPQHRKVYPFRITFPAKAPHRYQAFAASAPANRELTELALDYLSSMSLGSRDELDMLNLQYTATPYEYGSDNDSRVQQLDTYLRLDSDLATLMEAIDRGPGLDHTLLFVAGTPSRQRTRRDDEKWGIPYGEFSTRRAQSLLNSYLMAKYGSGEWVNAFRDGTVYLNRQLIAQRGLDLETMRSDAAGFVARMAGVVNAYTIDHLLGQKAGTNGTVAAREHVAPATAADIYVDFSPGWEVSDGTTGSKGPHMVSRMTATTAPCFILAPGVESRRLTAPVDARAIAPAVAGLLRIRSPNGASTPPLRLGN